MATAFNYAIWRSGLIALLFCYVKQRLYVLLNINAFIIKIGGYAIEQRVATQNNWSKYIYPIIDFITSATSSIDNTGYIRVLR